MLIQVMFCDLHFEITCSCPHQLEKILYYYYSGKIELCEYHSAEEEFDNLARYYYSISTYEESCNYCKQVLLSDKQRKLLTSFTRLYSPGQDPEYFKESVREILECSNHPT